MDRKKSEGLSFFLVVGLALTVFFIILYLQSAHRIVGRIGKSDTNIPLIDTALQEFLMENSRLPTQEEDLAALIEGPNELEETWDGPYIDPKKFIDPWGRNFIYRIPSLREGMEYDLICYGRDGKPGGKGEDEDIFNRD